MTAKLSKAQQAEVDAAIAAAKAGLVSASSKPHLVESLRKTWRKSGEHQAEQVKRFFRLLVPAMLPAVLDVISKGGHFDKVTLLGVFVPIVEGVYRQLYPALGAQAVDDAPGVTIVPEQVAEGDAAP